MSSDTGSRDVSPFSVSSSDVYLTPGDAPSPESGVVEPSSGLADRLDRLEIASTASSDRRAASNEQSYPNLLDATSSWAAVAARAPAPLSSVNTATVPTHTPLTTTTPAPSALRQRQSSARQSPPPAAGPRGRRTVALFQDACLLHKYSRAHDIGWIVERPERLRAIKTGVAAALARLEAANAPEWQRSAVAPPETKHAGDDTATGLEQMMGALGIADTKTSSRDVIGGPFDILFSAATMDVDDPALTDIHPLPNLPPHFQDVSVPTVTLPVPEAPPRPALTPSTSPSKTNPFLEAPASAPPKLHSKSDTGLEPWPKQLTALCRNASTAMGRAPLFSEIPAHLPQGDLYLTEQSEQAIFGALGAVCEAVDRVVEGTQSPDETGHDRAFVAIRPPGHPMGFCFVNNVAVAAAHAHQKHGVTRVVIFDIDLHHGNGTQEIAWRINAEANDALLKMSATPRKTSPKKAGSDHLQTVPQSLQVFYGSLHDIYSYPCEDGDVYNIHSASLNLSGGHSQWISNVHLDSFTDESDFYDRLYPRYRDRLLGAGREFVNKTTTTATSDQPTKTLVIISAGLSRSCPVTRSVAEDVCDRAGFDASEHESAGMSRHRRNVPTSFFHRFTQDACKFANDVANGKLIAVLEGGYSDRALASGVLGMMTGLATSPRGSAQALSSPTDLSSWWSEANLAKLEKACKPKRGKLLPWPTAVHSQVAAKDDRWLSRTVEIMSRLESTNLDGSNAATAAAVSAAAKAKKEPQAKTMQLRERRSRPNLRDDRTPQASPARGGSGGGSGRSAPPLPPMPVFGGRAFETTASTVSTTTLQTLAVSTPTEEVQADLKPTMTPKVKFRWGAGGI
ncbi:histone deacetylase [Microbotryomycetes sp. JL201]|nr:histone deacetylase [Microbotryomycetes sp. JL201]